MESRVLGRTGLSVSALGLGCGAVGGLMVRGEPRDQERAVALALDAGVTFIDTAPSYGDGRSESNLGRVLDVLRPGPEVVVATKFSVDVSAGADAIADQVARSLDASLRRLGRDRVDVLQLHNAIGATAPGVTGGREVPAWTVLGEVVPALMAEQLGGRIGWFGITGVGERDAVDVVVDAEAMDTAQVAFNLLNPSGARPLVPGFPAEDFGGLIGRAAKSEMGTIGIRALAGGALSGSEWRHPIGAEVVGPIGTGADYDEDVARARAFDVLIEGGWSRSLPEAAMRFAVYHGGLSTTLIGVSTIDQLEAAIAATERGPLPDAALEAVEAAWERIARDAQASSSR